VLLNPLLLIHANRYHPAKRRNRVELKNIQFRTTVLQNNSRHHGVYFEPQEKLNVINNFLITYSNSKSVQKLISELQAAKQHTISNPKYIGINESHIYADESKYLFINKYRLFLFQKDGTKIKSNQIDRAGTLGIGKRL
jgi:hypothetical protein